MTTSITQDTIQKWAADFGAEDAAALVARNAGARTEMSDAEREAVEAEIARRQHEEDPSADTTSSAIVADVLAGHGFHPAFEYGALVSGQDAFESLRAAAPQA